MITRNGQIVVWAAVAAVASLLVAAPARADLARYTAGHADIGAGYNAATRSLDLFLEVGGSAIVNGSPLGTTQEFDPADIAIVVPESVLTTGAAGLPAPFAGNPLYLLLQSSAGSATRPFLGFGAEEVDAGIFLGDSLKLSLTGFSTDPMYTPSGGQFVLYQTGFNGTPAMNSADGLSSADAIDLFAGGHDHFNMGFTRAGVYNLTFTVTGALVGGGTVSTDATYRFEVGNFSPTAVPEPSSIALTGLGLAGLVGVAVRRRRLGAA